MDVTDQVMDLAKRRGFLYPSYEAYGGLAGFYDYGPLGAVMKKRFEDLWRLVWHTSRVPAIEISCPRVTPHAILKASGHVDEFTDLVVRCEEGHPSRADHLVEAAGFEGTADALSPEAIDGKILELNAACPICGKAGFSKATPMNLMNATEIGPGSGRTGYLRPETAQGIFTDFPHLLRFQRGKLPFAALQVGGSNRNEISPRQGMLRLREFHMMESEVFFEDTSRPFPGFQDVAKFELTLVPGTTEKPVQHTLQDAVASGLIANEALGYFIGLTYRFLTLAGLRPDRLRFRQHLPDEMAHYANDCWDAEFHSDRYGWVECVGIADRGCYDLTQHANHTGKTVVDPLDGSEHAVPNTDFIQTRMLETPLELQGTRYVPNMGLLGRTFRADAKKIARLLEEKFFAAMNDQLQDHGLQLAFPLGLDAFEVGQEVQSEPAKDALTLSDGSTTFEVPAEALKLEKGSWTIRGVRESPSVIEPSFGVDRILYALWEHAYDAGTKNDEPYTWFRLSPHVAPIQVAILPLTNQKELVDIATNLEWNLRRQGIQVDVDTSGNIGRRYARQDEVGTPVCITIDPATLQDHQVTVRDRDTGDQVRVALMQLPVELGNRFQLDL